MIFEWDSEILVKTINALLTDSTIQNIYEEITSWRNKLQHLLLSNILETKPPI